MQAQKNDARTQRRALIAINEGMILTEKKQIRRRHLRRGNNRSDRRRGYGVAVLINNEHAVGIAVEGNPKVSAELAHQLTSIFRVQRATAVVDVEPVGLNAGGKYLSTKLLEAR